MSKRIFQDDPEALSKLKVKLEKLEETKAYWKAIKKIPRTYTHTQEDARWYMLPSTTTNIREVKKKIKKIEDRITAGKTLVRKTTFKNGRKVFYYHEVEN